MQWGLYTESNGFSDYKYWPISFSNMFLWGSAIGFDYRYHNWGPGGSNYNWDTCLEKFLCGVGADAANSSPMKVIGLGY